MLFLVLGNHPVYKIINVKYFYLNNNKIENKKYSEVLLCWIYNKINKNK